jgi:hypothetical protein
MSLLSHWKLHHTYDLRFGEQSADFPPGYVSSHTWPKTATANDDVLYARVIAYANVQVESVDFRLVKRVWLPNRFWPFPLWAWVPIRISTDRVHVDNLWDAELERQKVLNPYLQIRLRPAAQPDETGGYRMFFGQPGLSMLAGDSMWIRVITSFTVVNGENDLPDWRGHLEFQGPSNDGRRAYVRRSVVIKRSSPLALRQGQGERIG